MVSCCHGYHLCVIVWRIDELKKINETTSGPERKAALCGLLEQEAQLIASIGRHKILANQENKISSTRKLLDDVSTIASSGQYVCMYTVLCQSVYNKYVHTSGILVDDIVVIQFFSFRWLLQGDGLLLMARPQR